jgi:S1-C subfamily serine protease
MRLVVLLLTILTATPGYTARDIPADNLGYPVRILIGEATGSGFYLNADDVIYLVTARHVLYDVASKQEVKPLRASKARLVSYAADPKNQVPIEVEVNLEVLSASQRIEQSLNSDVAVITIGKINVARGMEIALSNGVRTLSEKAAIVGVDKKNTRRFEEVLVGNSTFLFGYPGSIGATTQPQFQFDVTRPLLRSGIVAGLDYRMRRIIVDAPAFRGNSGGPVVESEKLVENGRLVTRHRVIGVVTEFVPYTGSAVGNDGQGAIVMGNSGYAVLEPMDEVFQLIEHAK